MKDYLKTIALASLVAGGASAAFGTELRLSVETPPGHVRNLAAERWADLIAEMSDGEMTVQVFPAAQLYRSADAIRALASGALDMSIQANVTLSQFEPTLAFTGLPMFFGRSAEDVRTLLDGPLGDELWEMVEAKGIHVPEGGHFEYAPQHSAFTTEKKIETYADLEGVKLATPPSPVLVTVMKAMGAAPQATPRSEIVLQMTQGQIDGLAQVTELTITGGKLWEAGIQYIFADNAGWGFYIPVVSQRTMDKLTEDERQIIEDAWSEVVDWARDYSAEETSQARATNEANGITYVVPSQEEVDAQRAKMNGVQQEIVSDSDMNADFIARAAAELSDSGS